MHLIARALLWRQGPPGAMDRSAVTDTPGPPLKTPVQETMGYESEEFKRPPPVLTRFPVLALRPRCYDPVPRLKGSALAPPSIAPRRRCDRPDRRAEPPWLLPPAWAHKARPPRHGAGTPPSNAGTDCQRAACHAPPA